MGANTLATCREKALQRALHVADTRHEKPCLSGFRVQDRPPRGKGGLFSAVFLERLSKRSLPGVRPCSRETLSRMSASEIPASAASRSRPFPTAKRRQRGNDHHPLGPAPDRRRERQRRLLDQSEKEITQGQRPDEEDRDRENTRRHADKANPLRAGRAESEATGKMTPGLQLEKGARELRCNEKRVSTAGSHPHSMASIMPDVGRMQMM